MFCPFLIGINYMFCYFLVWINYMFYPFPKLLTMIDNDIPDSNKTNEKTNDQFGANPN